MRKWALVVTIGIALLLSMTSCARTTRYTVAQTTTTQKIANGMVTDEMTSAVLVADGRNYNATCLAPAGESFKPGGCRLSGTHYLDCQSFRGKQRGYDLRCKTVDDSTTAGATLFLRLDQQQN